MKQVILIVLITACSSTKKQHDMNNIPALVIIYKTNQDYSNLVPVTLNNRIRKGLKNYNFLVKENRQ